MAISRFFTGRDNHAAVVFDAISEGEIEGLVKGDSSIYFDDVPLRDGVTESKVGSFGTYATTVAASAVVTLPDGALDNVDTTGNPKRLITIKGAGKQGATSSPDITFSTTEGDHTITASAAFFTESMMKTSRQSNGAGLLRIVGAGWEGRDLLTFITVVDDDDNGLLAEVDVAPVATVSGKAGGIDHVSTIISYDPSNNQVTINDNAVTAVTGDATTGAGYTIIGPANTSAINTNNSGIKRNFDSVQYEFRSGTKHQKITKLIAANPPSASFVYSPNQRMNQTQISGVTGTGTNSAFTYAASAIGATEPGETDAVGWTIEIPSLIARSDKSGNEHNSWVEITVDFEYTRDGTNYVTGTTANRIVGRTDTALAAASIHDFTGNTRGTTQGFIVNQTTKPIIEQYEFSVQQFKPFKNWRLKFQRVNEPNKSIAHHEHTNEAIIKYVESHVTDKLTYPYTAYSAISFSAKDFSSPPKRGYHIRGKKIQVPTNYKTREELSSNSASYKRNVATGALETTYQDWDGNFRGDVSTFSATDSNPANYNLVYCNNPAWIYYDIVRDARYGLGHIVEASLVDKYSLYQIARYCDELVPDGKGGQEPRFTCNVYITKAQEAYKVLKDLASVFRAMTFWMDGQLVAVQDRPREPIYTFSQGNVIGGEFSYESTSERIRANQYLVQWMDPEDMFKSKVEIVDDVDNIIEKGRIVSKDFKAFGCTSQGQANRIGKWAITTDKLENEICKFSTGINAGFLRPGDIINIQDATINAVQFSGRIKAGTSTLVVTLDRAITLASGTTYKLHLIYPEGGAYLVSPEKVHINSTTYNKGDLILRDESNALINTFAKATNVKEDSDAASNGGTENNGKVELSWSENSRVETKTINTNNTTIAAGSNVTVTSAFSSAPNSEVIWAISGSNATSANAVAGIPVEYRVMGIEDAGEGMFNILAALYKKEKYDIVEKGYTLEDTRESVLNKPVSMHRDAFFASPASLTFNLKSVAASSSTSNSTEDLTGALEAVINWSTPLETWVADNILNATFVNEALDNSETTITVGDASSLAATGYGVIEEGTSQEEVVYWSAKSSNNLTVTRGALRSKAQSHDTGVSFEERQSYERVPPSLTNYEIGHNFGVVSETDAEVREMVSGGIHVFKVPNVTAGTYTVRVRAIYEGGVSEWIVLEKTITAPVTGQSQSLERLTFGGSISSGISVDSSGNWDVAESPYAVVNTSGTEYNITQATASHPQRRQAFGSLTDGQTAYALFDASAFASDPWRAIIQVTDTTYHKGQTGIAGSFTWWQDVGASANGLTEVQGTITTTLDSDTITGDGTIFLTDFAAGDFIRLHDSASTSFGTGSWYGYVDQVVSNTEIKVVGTVTKAFTTKKAYKGTFRPDFINDFILSKVIRNSVSSYTLINYVTGPGADGDAQEGDAGLRTIQGYLYYEKTSAGAPDAPGVAVYNFSAGDVTDGGSGATAVSDGGTTNVWRNSPRTQQATSSNYYWTVRYFGEEAAAESANVTVTYSNIVQQTSFSGVVTFSGGTVLTDGTSSKTPLEAADVGASGSTVIDGGRIDTGTIDADRISTDLLRITGTNFEGDLDDGTVGGWTIDADAIFSGSKDVTGYTSNGAITLSSTGEIHTPTFYVESDGSSAFKGTLTIGSTNLDVDNTLNENTTPANVSDNMTGITLTNAGLIYSGKSSYASTTAGWLLDYNSGGNPRFHIGDATNNLKWSGTQLNIAGALTAGATTRTVGIETSTAKDYIMYAGAATAATAPFRIKADDGYTEINKLRLYKDDGSIMFDSASGFTDTAYTDIAGALQAGVTTVSKSTTYDDDTTSSDTIASSTQKITTTSSDTFTVTGIKPANMSGFSSVDAATAIATTPSVVTLKLYYSANSNLSSPVQVGSTTTYTRVITGTASSSQYRVGTFYESEQGYQMYNAYAVNNEGGISSYELDVSGTTATLGAGTYYFWCEVSGTAGTTTSPTANSVVAGTVASTGAQRTITITSTGSTTFYIDSAGAGSDSATDTNTTYTHTWVDDSDNAILRLTAGGSGSGNDDLTLVAGDNITLSPSGDNLTIAATAGGSGDITAVVAGTGLSGGATSGSATLNVSGLTVSELADSAIQTGSESFADNDTSLMTSAAVQDKILSYGYGTGSGSGDITAVVAGTGMSGGATSGSATLTNAGVTSIVAGTGITISGGTGAVTVTNSISDTNLTTEEVQDIVGGMFSSNTETRISATYEDGDGTIDLVVDDMTANTNSYLTGVTKSTNTLTFAVTGQSNPTYTFGSNAFNSTAFTTNTGTVTGTGTDDYYARWTSSSGLEGRTVANVRSDLGLATSATTDTTNASNISSGTLAAARVATLNQNTSGTAAGLSGTPNIAVGTLTATGNITAYYSSDITLKDNIRPIESALFKVQQINGVAFDWNNKATKLQQDKCHDVGLIAQEVEKVLPEIVQTRDDGIKAIQYEKMVALLVESIKELKEEVDKLKEK